MHSLTKGRVPRELIHELAAGTYWLRHPRITLVITTLGGRTSGAMLLASGRYWKPHTTCSTSKREIVKASHVAMSLLEQAGVTVNPAGHGAATLCSKFISSAILILFNGADRAIKHHHILMLSALV